MEEIMDWKIDARLETKILNFNFQNVHLTTPQCFAPSWQVKKQDTKKSELFIKTNFFGVRENVKMFFIKCGTIYTEAEPRNCTTPLRNLCPFLPPVKPVWVTHC